MKRALRILVVEDNPINQAVLRRILERAGAEAIVAENGAVGEEAFLSAEANSAPFDLVFMDLQMPVQDGYTTISSLRQSGFTTPIVVLTAHSMDSERQRCFDLGCDEFATKPYRKAEILDFVSRFARTH